MPAFRFRLQTLLKLREADRQQRQVELAEAHRADQLLCEQMESLAAELEMHKRQVAAAKQRDQIDVNQLLNSNRYELVLKTQAAALAQQREQVGQEIERRRQAVVGADREVRVLERLRERQLRAHQQAEAVRETKQLDEVALRQDHRKRRR